MTEGEQQVVVFQLGREFYGVDISLVRGVETVGTITRIPRTPRHVKGVINLRGRVIPVVDLKMRLGLPQAGTGESRIAVIEVAGQTIGVLVDGVSEVATVSADQIDPPGSISSGPDADYILGVAHRGERLVSLLDLAKVLARNDRAETAVIR